MNKDCIINKQLTEVDYSDKRRVTNLVLDVETTLAEGNETLIFDIGWTISEVSNERMVVHRSYLVEEIFLNMNLMKRAHYFNKYTGYVKAGFNSRIILAPFNEIIKTLNDDLIKYNVNNMYAYNASFDKRAIEKTNSYINFGSTLVYDLKCLMVGAAQVMSEPKYIYTAIANNWLTAKGNVSTKAENFYRFITGDYDFVESHTGLEDSIIETKILWYLKNKRKIAEFTIGLHDWRTVSQRVIELEIELPCIEES